MLREQGKNAVVQSYRPDQKTGDNATQADLSTTPFSSEDYKASSAGTKLSLAQKTALNETLSELRDLRAMFSK